MGSIGPGLLFLGVFIWLGLLEVAKAIREHAKAINDAQMDAQGKTALGTPKFLQTGDEAKASRNPHKTGESGS